jgi:hypothetical protein
MVRISEGRQAFSPHLRGYEADLGVAYSEWVHDVQATKTPPAFMYSNGQYL